MPARLTRRPGIGKKTAERLLLELKGKLGADLGAAAGAVAASDHAGDILNALLALGYSEKEACWRSRTCRRAPAFRRYQARVEGIVEGLIQLK